MHTTYNIRTRADRAGNVAIPSNFGCITPGRVTPLQSRGRGPAIYNGTYAPFHPRFSPRREKRATRREKRSGRSRLKQLRPDNLVGHGNVFFFFFKSSRRLKKCTSLDYTISLFSSAPSRRSPIYRRRRGVVPDRRCVRRGPRARFSKPVSRNPFQLSINRAELMQQRRRRRRSSWSQD